jgi:hypothetical protein
VGSSSRNVVFGISPENATFQTQVINLDLKTEAISKGKGNFPLDSQFTQEYFYYQISCLAG